MALSSLAPLSMAAPLVPDALNGFGTATTFEVRGGGHSVEGLAYEWSSACLACLIRINLDEGVFVVVDSEDAGRQLAPGLYEIREYRGSWQTTQRAPFDFDVELHGIGKVLLIEPAQPAPP